MADKEKPAIPVSVMSIEMQRRIQMMAARAWDYIADDMLRCGDGKDMSRKSVIECTMDYLQNGQDKEALEAFHTLSFEHKHKVMRPAFPHAKYGF